MDRPPGQQLQLRPSSQDTNTGHEFRIRHDAPYHLSETNTLTLKKGEAGYIMFREQGGTAPEYAVAFRNGQYCLKLPAHAISIRENMFLSPETVKGRRGSVIFKYDVEAEVIDSNSRKPTGQKVSLKARQYGLIVDIHSNRKQLLVQFRVNEIVCHVGISVKDFVVTDEEVRPRDTKIGHSCQIKSKLLVKENQILPSSSIKKHFTIEAQDRGEIVDMDPAGTLFDVRMVKSNALVRLPRAAFDVGKKRIRNKNCRVLLNASDFKVEAHHILSAAPGQAPFTLKPGDVGTVRDTNFDGSLYEIKVFKNNAIIAVPPRKIELGAASVTGFTCRVKHDHSGFTISNVLGSSPIQGPFSVEPDDLGVILEDRVNDFHVRLLKNNAHVRVPRDSIDVGVEFKKEYTVKTNFRELAPTSVAQSLQTNYFLASDIRKHIAPILEGLQATHNKMPRHNPRNAKFYDSTASVQWTTSMIERNIACASSRLPRLLLDENASLGDVLDCCAEITRSFHRPGIYLQACWDFPMSSEHHGKVFIYIGKSKDIAMRFFNTSGHEESATNPDSPNYGQFHYQVVRAAKSVKAVAICLQDVNDPLGANCSDTAANERRDVLENISFLLFGSYSRRASAWVDPMPIANASSGNAAAAVIDIYETKEDAYFYNSIAEAAFRSSKFTPLSKRGNSGKIGNVDYGKIEGLNMRSPLSEIGDYYVPTLWARQTLPDRYLFCRSGAVIRTAVTDTREYHYVLERHYKVTDDEGTTESSTHIIVQPDAEKGLGRNTKVWTMVEIMKKPRGEDVTHEVDYYRQPKVSPCNYAKLARSWGCQIMWQNSADGKWYMKYNEVEDNSIIIHDLIANQPGASKRLAYGLGIHCYFMRKSLANRPTWFPDFGFAKVVDVRLDFFKQRLEMVPIRGLAEEIPSLQLSPYAAIAPMRDLGLEKVGGDWRSRNTTSWLKDDKSFQKLSEKEQKRVNLALARGGLRCDYCNTRTWYSGADPAPCDRVDGTNRCDTCANRVGIPCSWSSIRAVAGDDWKVQQDEKDKHKVHKNVSMVTERTKEVMAGLILRPVNRLAHTATEIQDPQFHHYREGDEETEVEE